MTDRPDIPEEARELAAEALWNERERRDPTGEAPDDWYPPGDNPDQPPPREPFLWEQMVAEGKFEGDQEECRADALAVLQAAAPALRRQGAEEAERERRRSEQRRDEREELSDQSEQRYDRLVREIERREQAESNLSQALAKGDVSTKCAYKIIHPPRRYTLSEVKEVLEKLERFDPEHDESCRQDFALGNDPIIMESYEEGDWLRRSDVLAALSSTDSEGQG